MTERAMILLALVLSVGCAAPAQKQTPAKWIKENTRVISQLSSYRSDEQQQGINRFLTLGKEQGSAVVIYFLEDPAVNSEERVVVVLARILAIWKDTRGIPYLLDALVSTQDDGIRRVAEEGLVSYGANRRIGLRLEESIQSSSREVRRAGIAILSKMKSPAALGVLGGKLGDEDAEVRALCLLGVVESEHSTARTGFIFDALADADAEIREIAWAALRKQEGVPEVYDPVANPAARAQGVADLRRWAKSGGRGDR